jgi:hypothetical protein
MARAFAAMSAELGRFWPTWIIASATFRTDAVRCSIWDEEAASERKRMAGMGAGSAATSESKLLVGPA